MGLQFQKSPLGTLTVTATQNNLLVVRASNGRSVPLKERPLPAGSASLPEVCLRHTCDDLEQHEPAKRCPRVSASAFWQGCGAELAFAPRNQDVCRPIGAARAGGAARSNSSK